MLEFIWVFILFLHRDRGSKVLILILELEITDPFLTIADQMPYKKNSSSYQILLQWDEMTNQTSSPYIAYTLT